MLNQLSPAYVPLLTFLGTLLIVAVGILYHNSRITDFSSRISDVKDLIKTEARVTEAHIRRLEEKIDPVGTLLSTRHAHPPSGIANQLRHKPRAGRLLPSFLWREPSTGLCATQCMARREPRGRLKTIYQRWLALAR